MPSKGVLSVHLPHFLDDLATCLSGAEKSEEKYAWKQGNKLDEGLREIEGLRATLEQEVEEFEKAHPGTSEIEREKTAHIIHSVLDGMAVDFVMSFARQQQQFLRSNSQLLLDPDLNAEKSEQIRFTLHEAANHVQAITLIAGILKKSTDLIANKKHREMLLQNIRTIYSLLENLRKITEDR